MVLKILEKHGPMRGIDVMNYIQEISHGWWKPSPGSIYPLLSDLAEEGIVKRRADDKYELTVKYMQQPEPMDSFEETIVGMDS